MTGIDLRQARSYELGAGETAWPTAALFFGALAVQAGSAWAGLAGLLRPPVAVLLCAAAAFILTRRAKADRVLCEASATLAVMAAVLLAGRTA